MFFWTCDQVAMWFFIKHILGKSVHAQITEFEHFVFILVVINVIFNYKLIKIL